MRETGMQKGTRGSPFFELDYVLRSGCGFHPAGFRHLVAPDAARTHLNPAGSAIDLDPDGLKIRIPATPGPIVGVTHMIAGRRPFATHSADPRHKPDLPKFTTIAHYAVALKYSEPHMMTQPEVFSHA